MKQPPDKVCCACGLELCVISTEGTQKITTKLLPHSFQLRIKEFPSNASAIVLITGRTCFFHGHF